MENCFVWDPGVVGFNICWGQNISPSKLLKGVRSEFQVDKRSSHVAMRLWRFRMLPVYLNLNHCTYHGWSTVFSDMQYVFMYIRRLYDRAL